MKSGNKQPGKEPMHERLIEIVERFPACRLAVIGDLIADQFLYGETSRVSREAPVLVLKYREILRVPGGAANAANNLLDLGCRVTIVGAVGEDAAGAELLDLLAKKGADVRHVSRLKNYATPIKTRILAGAHHSQPQQIVRVDRETPLAPALIRDLSRIGRKIGKLHGIVISDYGFGSANPSVLREIASFARSEIPRIVDSRFRMAEYHGATSITPNITELEAATGTAIDGNQELLHRIARRVLSKQKLGSLLVTQGRFGMTLVQPSARPIHIPIYGTDEVADVTGAGDTVIAVFTAALASGGSPEEAARLANYAGGIVVMKRGTATVSREELSSAVKRDLST
jgi:rfaE bifunctional protein kinase chain/domain